MRLISGGSDISPTDPDPSNFNIKRAEIFGNYSLMEVVYPNCTNFEGRKIILMEIDETYYNTPKKLDPHFLEDNKIIARFRPTGYGWYLGRKFARLLMGEDEK